MQSLTEVQTGYYATFSHRLGTVRVAATDAGIVQVGLPSESNEKFWSWLKHAFSEAQFEENKSKTKATYVQLEEYFDGKRRDFSLKLDLHGSDFQKKIWQAIAKIPYGKTISYGELAEWVGLTKASARSAGAATGSNPFSIIIPCHRVIGSDGSLIGYGGGLPMKTFLLELERGSQPLSF